MMRKEVAFIFIFLLSLSFVAAGSFTLDVTTKPFHVVEITVAEDDPGYFQKIDNKKSEADQYGKVSFDFAVNPDTVKLYVNAKHANKKIYSETLLGIETSGVTELVAYPSGYVPPEMPAEGESAGEETEEGNETIENNDTETADVDAGSDDGNVESGITGNVVSDGEGFGLSPYALGIGLLAIVAVGVIVLVGRLVLKPRMSVTGAFADAEKKIQAAQKEIDQAKQKDKILQEKNKLKEQKKEAKEMRKEEKAKLKELKKGKVAPAETKEAPKVEEPKQEEKKESNDQEDDFYKESSN